MTVTAPVSDLAHLFPWGVGEVRASLALCPPAAFHIRGFRLERVTDGWWGELGVCREDQGSVVTWPGFRVRRGRGWEIALPPYLADLDGAWRALLLSATQRLAATALDAPRAGDCVYVSVAHPAELPRPGDLGAERVTPVTPGVLGWIARAKRYRFAAALARHARVLDVGCGLGDGSRLLARAAQHVLAVDRARETVTYAARAYRCPRLTFAVAADVPDRSGAVDLVTCLDGVATADEAHALIVDAARALAPDGRLVVTVGRGATLSDDELHEALAARFVDVETWWQRPADGLDEVSDEREITADRAAGARLVAVARRPEPAGFSGARR
ncbi:MAG: class I SAM-dependent methyltransferase [Candidatus Rokubacteria bacterium]|nr:class I SAM-dependent methyltransferase [Candidatus Rokubacteria bacterium]